MIAFRIFMKGLLFLVTLLPFFCAALIVTYLIAIPIEYYNRTEDLSGFFIYIPTAILIIYVLGYLEGFK